MVHSEGKRDKLDDGVVIPSKTYNFFSLKTVEEKVDHLFTTDVISTPEKTTQIRSVQMHRRSNYRTMMSIETWETVSPRIKRFRIKPQKKIVSLLLVFLLLFVVVVAAPFVNLPDNSGLFVSISPSTVWTGDCLYVNVTVPSAAKIISGTCDMGGIETVNLSLVTTASINQVWQAVWMVHDVSVGDYVTRVTIIDEDNTSNQVEVGWSVVSYDDTRTGASRIALASDKESRFTFEYRNGKDTVSSKEGADGTTVFTKPKQIKRGETEKKKIETSVYDPQGRRTNIGLDVDEGRNDTFSITLLPTRGFRAGLYTLDVALTTDNVTYKENEEVMRGLVSLNTEKSIYTPGEVAEFILVVLDKEGHSVRGGDIELLVTDSAQKTVSLSTSNGTITPGDDYGIYFAEYLTEREGEQTINVTASIDGVPVTFSTNFMVLQQYDFDILRTAQSKIDPTRERSFDVIVDVESFVDVDSLMIKEYVPADFEISNTDATVLTEDSTKILTWERNVIGNKTSVRYSYSVPDFWPYLYAVGPVELQYDLQKFKEARPWFVAVDPATIPTVTTNISTGVEETNATLWGYLENDGGESCTVRFEYGTTTTYGTNTSNQTKSNDSMFLADLSSLTKGQLYHYRAYANNTVASDTGDDLMFLTKPDSPSGLTAQANSSSVMYLTWTKGTGANRTYIERSTNSVWTRGVGTEMYNNTGTWCEDIGREENTTYYYQAWSYTTWTSTPTIHQWSDTNASANNRTNVLPTITNPGPANEGTEIGLIPLMNITVHDFNDGSLTVRWYSNSSGSWVLFGINSSVGNGTYHWTNSNFSWYATTYWWNVSVSDGQDVIKSSAFHFTTIGADISLGVTPSTWNQGTILIGSSNATTGLYFNLTNQGSVPILVQIKATNATNATTGAKWNLTGSSGLDNFSLQYNKSGDVRWTTINLTYDTFVLNLPATGIDWLTFDLNLIMATSSSIGVPLSFTITFKSVAA
ncbi:MAG TPA: hypothetical protein VN365_06570 [Candidatus Thermoplasmatota archaeon]|nr:hypothetical protein [Candidatus Thermoplasmatota archaeon]